MNYDDAAVLSIHIVAAGIVETVSPWVGLLVGLIAISGGIASVFSARRRATDRAKAELDAAFKRGFDSRNDEVALLRSQRDDAREDRDRDRRQLELLQGSVLTYGRSLPPPLPPPPARPSPGDH